MLYINLKFSLNQSRTGGLFGFSNIRPITGQFVYFSKGGFPLEMHFAYTQSANGLLYASDNLEAGSYRVIGVIKVNSV